MTDELSRNERIKEASDYLRGTLADGLREEITGAIIEDDAQLVKFHGMYLQDDRDLRPERTRKKMEKAFAFMIRVRIPGGVLTPQQWLALDKVARDYGNGTMRLTTRQTVQLHGVIKSNLKATLKSIDTVLLNSIAACGDINRNVMCNVLPEQSRAHAAAIALARSISDHLLPHTPAYREIWLDGERIAGGEGEVVEPIYGKTYLPRKFKVVVAVPPSNDVDIFAHDLGYIAITDDAGNIAGWNVTVGGGMGMTHGEPDTYPRIAEVMGFCRTEDVVKVSEAVVTVQRDWGDRKNRKHARLKYTIEDRGLDAFRAEVERRSGVKLVPAKPYTFTATGDRYGWTEGIDGRGHLTLFVQNGRVHDVPGAAQQSALRTIAQMHDGDLRITPNQNLIISNVPTEKQAEIERIAREAGLLAPWSWLAAQFDGLRRAADLRPRACGERALSAGAARRARSETCRARAVRRRHRHPHDRMPERLRAALSRRDRIGRQRAGPLQPLSRRGLRRLAHEQALRGRSRSRRHRRRARSVVCGLRRRAAEKRALRRLRDPYRPHRRERQRRRLSFQYGQAKGGMSDPREPKDVPEPRLGPLARLPVFLVARRQARCRCRRQRRGSMEGRSFCRRPARGSMSMRRIQARSLQQLARGPAARRGHRSIVAPGLPRI